MSDLAFPPIGSHVGLGEGVSGILTAICIRQNDHVTYEVSWWSGANNYRDWFTDNEIELDWEGHHRKIGFSSTAMRSGADDNE